ncbi:MAG: SMP-30/gluconolactonase/LRE family protein [Pseudomonadota bacterium]
MFRPLFCLAMLVACTPSVEAPHANVSVTLSLDPKANELPEGLAVRGDEVFLGLAMAQKVIRIADGEQSEFATYPSLPQGKGFLTGLSVAPDGSLWAGLASYDEKTTTGVYKVGSDGGNATLFATAEGMVLPNDIAWMNGGDALVSDSAAGVIWRITPDGEASEWFADPNLKGDPLVCEPDELGFAIGANGLDFGPDDALYIANTDRAQIFRIDIEEGNPKTMTALNETNCALLEGADGIVAGPKGVVVAVNRTDQLSIVSYDGAVSSWSEDDALDFPASIAPYKDGFYISNFGLITASSGTARPGLLFVK